MKLFKSFVVLLLPLLLLGTVGCAANNTEDTETTLPIQSTTQATTAQNTTEPIQPVNETMDVAVYYLKSDKNEFNLVREIHKVEKSDDAVRTALTELISGTPLTKWAYRVMPPDTKILSIIIDKGLATVDFSAEVLKANVGAEGESLGINAIVNTLTEFPSIKKVQFTVNGQAENGMDWWGHVGLYDQPFERNLSSVREPAIWVNTPVAGQTISNPVKISGSAMVFEASVCFRLRDSNGKVLVDGFTQAAIGAPDHGDFNAELAFTATGAGEGQLEVYEESMKDGSDMNKVIIPVNWE